MSFALQYRKKLQQQAREAARKRKENEGFVSPPAQETDTGSNRRRVLFALMIAGAILAAFNSGGLVQYSYDLAENPAGQKLVEVAEDWHDMMQETRATDVIDHIRGSVAVVRESTWEDLAASLASAPAGPQPEMLPDRPVVPANGDPMEAPDLKKAPKIVRPDGPVMRASVNGQQAR
ncbi:MAG: hypothetical protein AAGF14_10140 [Pseudomonadota bacterium]